MLNRIKYFGIASVLLMSTIIISGWGLSNASNDWIAPPTASNIVNPLLSNEDATKEGKKLYKQLCSICHGDRGKGDGIAGASLNPRPANFSSISIQNQSDGALYWKINEGRAPMASYKDLLNENQKWQLINFIRTFKK